MIGVARIVQLGRACRLQRALGILWVLASVAAGGRAAAKPAEPDLEPTPARLWVVAPSAKGAWLLRIDNEGDQPIRVPADVRLLRFEVRALDQRGKWPRRPTICDGPRAFGLTATFPYQRELVIEPGQSFVEQFDPRVICFGKQAKLLAPGSLVKPTYGWEPRSKWSRRAEKPPFAADAAKRPRMYSPRKRLEAPTMLLSYAEPEFSADPGRQGGPGEQDGSSPEPAPTPATPGADGSATGSGSGQASPAGGGAQPDGGAASGSEAPGDTVADKLRVPDELAAQLALGTSQYADASHPRDIVVSLSTKNVGERPRKVAFRRRQLSFTITGPDGVKQCRRRSVQHVIPPDLFRQLSAGNQIRMRVRLAELCPWDTFKRPGVYVATPTLHALEGDRGNTVGALTTVVTSKAADPKDPAADPADDATLIRVRSGMEPYYKQPPVVVPSRFFKIGEEAYRREQEAAQD
ncbi:MAG: hypothetical protein JRI23_26480 [Deltaproteobacteria bacterium]|nr:hypothetical protein [Deltaproteobacteria bacterium]MBW2535583.1 hypothetical protein [Deltaproteobacteria bacterium]